MLQRIFALMVVIASFLIVPLASAETTSGEVKTGGRFILKNHHGKIVTDQDFNGKFMLVYFGYTYCPDVCPTSLQVMSRALDIIKEDAKHIQPLFITVDPKRDTAAVLRDYVSAFHPSILGLTGSIATIESVTKKYRVVYSRSSEKDADADDYFMDHTASMFFMGPNGEYLARFPYAMTSEQMAEKMRGFVAQMKGK
jgi:protein SCO1/2